MRNLKKIAEDNGIDDISDWYGKYLLLQLLLDKSDNADNKMLDIFKMFGKEIEEILK